jgi:hypothetical protein
VSDKPSLTRSQAVEKVLAQIDGPIPVDEVCNRVLTIWPSKAKNPLGAMRSHLRHDHAGTTLVFLDAKTILPLPIAMRGVRFRVPLSRREANRGALIIHPAFDHFLRRELDPVAVQLLDQNGHPLPVHVITIREQADTPFGKGTMEQAAFDLGGWFRAQRVRRDDSILVTVEDWTNGTFRNKIENWPTCCSACWRKPTAKSSMLMWPFRRPTPACPIRAAILAVAGLRSSAAIRA